jgi:hypothetical protein
MEWDFGERSYKGFYSTHLQCLKNKHKFKFIPGRDTGFTIESNPRTFKTWRHLTRCILSPSSFFSFLLIIFHLVALKNFSLNRIYFRELGKKLPPKLNHPPRNILLSNQMLRAAPNKSTTRAGGVMRNSSNSNVGPFSARYGLLSGRGRRSADKFVELDVRDPRVEISKARRLSHFRYGGVLHPRHLGERQTTSRLPQRMSPSSICSDEERMW